MRLMSGKISSDLEHDLCRFVEKRGGRGGTGRGGRRRAVISLVIRSCFQSEAWGGGGWGRGLLISFLYDSQSALLKYAICSEQSEDDKCRNQSGKESLNEADLRSLPPGESGFLPPPSFFSLLR